MLALQIENIKGFMSHLLIHNTFDRFLVSDVSVTTFTTFHIDGVYHPEFYADDVTPEEAENIPEGSQMEWKTIRPFMLQVIRGKRLPLSFHFVLQFPADETAVLLEENGLTADPDEIYGLFLNLQYRNVSLTLTTGSSLRSFSEGHAIDQAWDRKVQELLTVDNIL